MLEKSLKFAVRIVKLYQYLVNEKKESIISKQIIRSGTSIGANANEAAYGVSQADFVSKMQISLKETAETEYWLRLLVMTGYIDEAQCNSMINHCLEDKIISYHRMEAEVSVNSGESYHTSGSATRGESYRTSGSFTRGESYRISGKIMSKRGLFAVLFYTYRGEKMEQPRLKLYTIDMKYVINLSKADDNVMSVSSQIAKAVRPFVGIIVLINDRKYCIPLSSPKKKFENKKNGVDFMRITDPSSKNEKGAPKIIGVLNINNMLPVEESLLTPIDLRIKSTDSAKTIS